MRGAATHACLIVVAVTVSIVGRASCFVPCVPLRLETPKRHFVSLSMHMGHSHSHQHSHGGTVGIRPTVSSSSSSPSKTLPVWAKRRRISALLLFCAITFLGPPLARHRQLANSDVAAFLVTATSLFLLEPIRDQVKHILLRIRQLGDGISRHSSPISAKYLFKNENAADRITLVG